MYRLKDKTMHVKADSEVRNKAIWKEMKFRIETLERRNAECRSK